MIKSYLWVPFRHFVRGSLLEWLSTYYVLLLKNYNKVMCQRGTRLRPQD